MDELTIIENKIYEIRGQRVMLDFDLAEMYGIGTKRLKEQVRRNMERFPSDFMFQVSGYEWNQLVANCDQLPPNMKHASAMPFAFTEQGVAMLSGVLRSPQAIEVNINIMRAFVRMRQNPRILSAAIQTRQTPLNRTVVEGFKIKDNNDKNV